ncbi:hypothetical protein BOTBODRAFT_120054 [Botryobasidium botryosum FD-172 SS1]|uniref:GOLD domain-containing protein n=1 Tax=Botryobasidium botryosum (strain FD-172 SS1) TaxID=930990 RepID=A0A067LYI0_BOTB1|nr:hypothetical protein BOTBODRAFT_120054 [Botryobasidium botryosum FD-172 SS1]
MFLSRPCLPLFFLSALILSLASHTHAIKFSVPAAHHPDPKCIWNAAHNHALIVITANVGPGVGQRVDIEILDRSANSNVYLSKRDISGETRLAVTSHADADVGVCFRNHLDTSIAAGDYARNIDLEVDIGADAVDYNAIAAHDGLSGLEVEMRKIEGISKEILDELDYLKRREERFQSTNESTYMRVQNFGLFTLVTLIALGVWQIFHLRAFFRRKYLID